MKLLWSYRALQAEMIVTQMVVSMTIINLLFADIGLSQTQIGLSQAIFTGVVLMLNVPLGWLADRSGRKIMNIAGDGLTALGFLLYVFASSFGHVVIAEILIGIGVASSMGVDVAMQRAYCEKLKLSFAKESARIHTIAPVAIILGMLAGGWLGSIDIRAPMAADVTLFAIGMLLSLAVKDIGPRLSAGSKHTPSKGMLHITKESIVHNKQLSARILGVASTRESTHAIIWLLAPVTLATSAPVWFVGISWAILKGAHTPGALLAGRTSHHSAAKKLGVPITLSIAGSLLCMTLIVWLLPIGIVLLGLAAGYAKASTGPLLAEVSHAASQTTIASIAATVGQLAYIPMVIGVNWMAAKHGIVAGYALNTAVFAVLAALAIRRVAKNP